MAITPLSRPPADLNSFLGRKWLESLVKQSTIISGVADLVYLVLSPNAAIPNARTLTGSTNIEITDGGAGGAATLDLTPSGVSAGTYESVTVDEKGRVTAGSATAIPDGNIKRLLFMGY